MKEKLRFFLEFIILIGVKKMTKKNQWVIKYGDIWQLKEKEILK